jgi:hypothetical protein
MFDLQHILAAEGAMWVPTQNEATVMYARFLKARHGTEAGKFARKTAETLQNEGDLEGHKVWNAVADAVDHHRLGWPQLRLLVRSRAA